MKNAFLLAAAIAVLMAGAVTAAGSRFAGGRPLSAGDAMARKGGPGNQSLLEVPSLAMTKYMTVRPVAMRSETKSIDQTTREAVAKSTG